MPRIHTFHRGSGSWPTPLNHLDGRRCPTCWATVHGPEAQEGHHSDHLDEAEYKEKVNESLDIAHARIMRLAEAIGLLDVVLADNDGQNQPSEWRHAIQIGGGQQYIPAGESAE